MEVNHFTGNGLEYNHEKCERCLSKLFKDKACSIGVLNIVQVSDEELLKINQKHLNHDYYTGIITSRSGDGRSIEQGELYISYERATENKPEDPENELLRLIVHGSLHLTGMNDTTKNEREEMRVEENKYLEFHVEL